MGGASPELPLILSSKSKSGYLGVYQQFGDRWQVRVAAGTSGKTKCLDTFDTATEAAAAYAEFQTKKTAYVAPSRSTKNRKLYADCVPVVGKIIVTFNTAEEAAAAFSAHVAELRTNVTWDDVRQACDGISMCQVGNVQRILSIENFKTAFTDPDGDVILLKAAKQQQAAKRHLVYADATVKMMIIAIVAIIKQFRADITTETRQKWTVYLQQYNKKASCLTELKQQTEAVMDFDDFLQMIQDLYGVTSKEYMIAIFYSPLMPQTFRDNLQFVLIQTVVPSEMKRDTNYIVINNLEKRADQGTKATVYLNDYKTIRKYGEDIIHLPPALVDLVLNYVREHNIGYNQYLFGKAKLSLFISNMTDPNPPENNCLHRVTINTLRQMRISKICAGKPMTVDDWATLASESKHDVSMTQAYIRKIVKWNTDTKGWACMDNSNV